MYGSLHLVRTITLRALAVLFLGGVLLAFGPSQLAMVGTAHADDDYATKSDDDGDGDDVNREDDDDSGSGGDDSDDASVKGTGSGSSGGSIAGAADSGTGGGDQSGSGVGGGDTGGGDHSGGAKTGDSGVGSSGTGAGNTGTGGGDKSGSGNGGTGTGGGDDSGSGIGGTDTGTSTGTGGATVIRTPNVPTTPTPQVLGTAIIGPTTPSNVAQVTPAGEASVLGVQFNRPATAAAAPAVSGGSLAATGWGLADELAIAGAFLALGGGAVVLGRKRRQAGPNAA